MKKRTTMTTTRDTMAILTVFTLLMAAKLFLLLQVPLPEAWHGDAGDYVGKALYFNAHGEFPRIRSAAPDRPALAYSDFRPPGYPLFVAALLGFGKSVPEITQSVRLAHFGLDLVTTGLLLWIVWRFHGAVGYRWLAALLLGVQPWTSAFILTLNPDTLTTFLLVSGVMLLALFVTGTGGWTRSLALLGASGLISLTFLIRPEMIVFAFALLLLGLALTWPALKWRGVARYGVLAAIPFLAVTGANMAYRWQVAQEIRIYGEFRHSTPGLVQWTKTWIGSQTDKEQVIWGPLMIGPAGFAALPARAFSDEAERQQLIEVARAVAARGAMTAAEDRLFGSVAEQSIARDPMTYYVWNRLYSAANFWVNLNNASHYLHAFSLLPGALSKLLTGGFLTLKLVILGFFVVGLVLFPYRGQPAVRERWYLTFLLLGLAFVLMRTLYFGGIVGYVEYRYAVVAWPFVLALALYGIAGLWGRFRPIGRRTGRCARQDGGSVILAEGQAHGCPAKLLGR